MKDRGIVWAAAAAVIAVVVMMLIFFNYSATGKVYDICPEGYRVAATGGVGGQGAFVCILNENVGPLARFPSWTEHEERRRKILLG